MGGPNLEVVKFGFYMFFPVVMMLKFGDPVWYENYVKPYGEIIWPPYESTHKPPKSSEELHEELARLKAERIAKRSTSTSTSSAPVLDTADLRTSTTASGSVLSEIRTGPSSSPLGATSSGSGFEWMKEGKRLV